MPSKIRKRGENSYLLTVTSGYDGDGKQIVYTKTVKASSPRQAEKLYSLFVAEIEKGQFAKPGKMTLNQFYDYWLENYAEGRHAPKTIAYNKSLYKRISQALGHKRIDQIEPKHLLSFYKNLSEAGIRQDPNADRRSNQPEYNSSKNTLSPNTIRKYHILLLPYLKKQLNGSL